MADETYKVMFKRGPHSHLPETGAIEGAFYLAYDTNRLYIGHDGKAVELNKSITTVNSVGDLPQSNVAVGQFYYISGTNAHTDTAAGGANGNILAVCTAVNNGIPTWTQVNPDTNDNDHLKSVSVVTGNKDAQNRIPYTLTFQMADKAGVNKTGDQPSVTFYVNASDIINLADVQVTTSDVSEKTVTVTTQLTDGTNTSTGGSFKIKGGDNVTLTKDATSGAIVIDTGISSGSIQNKVAYNNSNNTVTQNVQVNGEDSGDTLTIGANRGLQMASGVIGHANEIAGGAGNGSPAETAITLNKTNNSFTAVTNVAYDAYGHITSETYNTVTLPTWKANSLTAGTNVENGAQDAGTLTFAIGDQTGDATDSFKSGKILYNTLTVDGHRITKYNTEDLGSFYSASAIDAKLRTLDALTYQGPIAAANELPSNNVHNGDTYKATADFSLGNGQQVHAGDLIIATGTEGSDGTLSTPIDWSVVAGGTDTDTTYKTKVTAGGENVDANVGIISNTANGDFTQFVKLKSDAWVDITPTAGEDAGELTFAHAAPQAAVGGTFGDNTTSVAAGGSIKVPKITKDAKGHIVSIEDVTISTPGAMQLGGDASTDTMYLKDASGVAQYGELKFAGDAWITADLTVNATDDKKLTTTISHNVPTGLIADGSTATSTDSKDLQSATAADRQFAAVTSVTRDAKGHVLNYNIETITLGQVAYTLSDSVANNVATIALKDQAGNDAPGKVAISSDTITFADTTAGFSADIIWGTF